METKKNKLIFPLICAILSAVMYFFAFHSERDENKILKEKIIKLEKLKR
jgi:preprotein translocase subunit YajC